MGSERFRLYDLFVTLNTNVDLLFFAFFYFKTLDCCCCYSYCYCCYCCYCCCSCCCCWMPPLPIKGERPLISSMKVSIILSLTSQGQTLRLLTMLTLKIVLRTSQGLFGRFMGVCRGTPINGPSYIPWAKIKYPFVSKVNLDTVNRGYFAWRDNFP